MTIEKDLNTVPQDQPTSSVVTTDLPSTCLETDIDHPILRTDHDPRLIKERVNTAYIDMWRNIVIGDAALMKRRAAEIDRYGRVVLVADSSMQTNRKGVNVK